MDKVKRYIPYLLLTGLTLFFCRIFVGRYGIFGASFHISIIFDYGTNNMITILVTSIKNIKIFLLITDYIVR
ncbi:MAG: hypothetical protein BHW17_00940 [Dorea sp. 42_8]|nr:MAG: hypothetical protein BHW17_00940 [Dorea sp. 42_8]